MEIPIISHKEKDTSNPIIKFVWRAYYTTAFAICKDNSEFFHKTTFQRCAVKQARFGQSARLEA